MAERRSATVAARPARQKAVKAPRPMSPTQRKSLATQQIMKALGVSDQGKESTAASNAAITAALEIISDRLAYDTDIRQTLHQKYDELQALGPKPKPPKPDLGPAPVPLGGGTWADYKPYGRYDPYKLLHDFGGKQLHAVLVRATQKHLLEAVRIIQEREPGTKTKPSGRTNPDLIDYIMQNVAPEY